MYINEDIYETEHSTATYLAEELIAITGHLDEAIIQQELISKVSTKSTIPFAMRIRTLGILMSMKMEKDREIESDALAESITLSNARIVNNKEQNNMKKAIVNTKQCFLDDNINILSVDAIHNGELCLIKATTINKFYDMYNDYEEICGMTHIRVLEKKYKKLSEKQKAVIS